MPAQTVIKKRRDTAANWVTANPTLAAGEEGYETDTGLSKTGNGSSAWTSLSYDATAHSKQMVKAAESIAKGQAVYVSGSDGTYMTVSKASNASEATSSKTFGLMNGATSSGALNTVVTSGLLGGLDTSSATAGDPVWLGTSGNLIYGLANKPSAPAHMVFIGIVEQVSSTAGKIYVSIQNGFELEELHNVSITSVATGDVLQYDGTSWVNAELDALPAQATHDGQYLTTDGSTASWTYLDLSGKQDVVSGVSSTEIGYLDGVTSAIQTQINSKAASSHTHAMADLTGFEITSPSTGQTLQYNGTKWVNAAASAGGETISSFLLMGA